MPAKANHHNKYQCTIEVNQNGKYCVRVRAMFARKGWVLSVFFLTSSFNHAMRKLEETLQFLQQKEERLRFWGVDHSAAPIFAGDRGRGAGLPPARRAKSPRGSKNVPLSREK